MVKIFYLSLLRKKPYIPLGFMIITLVIVMLPPLPHTDRLPLNLQWCPVPSRLKGSLTLPVFLKEVSPDARASNIYQIVSSDPETIMPRNFCSLESYCRKNPKSIIWFLLLGVDALEGTSLLWLQLLQDTYKNLRVASLDLQFTVKDTPLESIVASGKLQESIFPVNHLSDVLRLAVVSKIGGLYTDFDFICLKNIEQIKNTMALALTNRPMNGFFHFDAGHPLLQLIMGDDQKNFNGNEWGFNGPYLFSRVLKKNCPKFDFLVESLSELLASLEPEPEKAANDVQNSPVLSNYRNFKATVKHSSPSMTETSTGACQNVKLILDTRALMPVNVSQIKNIFQENSLGYLNDLVSESYALHLFNRITKPLTIERGARTAAEDLFSSSCPLVHRTTAVCNIQL